MKSHYTPTLTFAPALTIRQEIISPRTPPLPHLSPSKSIFNTMSNIILENSSRLAKANGGGQRARGLPHTPKPTTAIAMHAPACPVRVVESPPVV